MHFKRRQLYWLFSIFFNKHNSFISIKVSSKQLVVILSNLHNLQPLPRKSKLPRKSVNPSIKVTISSLRNSQPFPRGWEEVSPQKHSYFAFVLFWTNWQYQNFERIPLGKGGGGFFDYFLLLKKNSKFQLTIEWAPSKVNTTTLPQKSCILK